MREPVCCTSGYGKQGYHRDSFSFSFSKFFCTTKWLCQFDAVCSIASCQISHRGLCTLLVYTSIIHMIFGRHTKEDVSILGLPFSFERAASVQTAMSRKCATKLSLTTPAVQCLVTLSFHIAWCTAAAMKDVENITLLNQPGVVGIWRWNDKNKYYPLSDFRNESARNYYDVWPEDIHDSSFQFPCEDRKSRLMLSNFTYAMNEGLVESLQYYDLGIVYRYRPYWRRPTTTCFGCTERLVGFPVIYCESGDLRALYYSRYSCYMLLVNATITTHKVGGH